MVKLPGLVFTQLWHKTQSTQPVSMLHIAIPASYIGYKKLSTAIAQGVCYDSLLYQTSL